MKTNCSPHDARNAFTITDLCVLLVCITLLSVLALPALAAGKMQSATAGCLFNLRHLMTGWESYRTDNNDVLMPNSIVGANGTNTWTGASVENWTTSSYNTNPSAYTNSAMWQYGDHNLSVFRCPADVVPSANGVRIRSYSMNGQMSPPVAINPNVNWLVYSKGGDLVRPAPANAFVFADESPASLNDGYLQLDLNSGSFPNLPACYLEGGCGFSFADGHAELHRWQTSALLIPVRQNVTINNISTSGGNADWLWLRQHSSSH